jgi:glutathione S-transferase
MILIGMFDSPFVRRVAISMRLLGLDCEHRDWSVGRDFARIREYNPLGRVPTLVLDDGVALVESGAILDYLDELAGRERALLPASGAARREALRLMAIASGTAEKAVLQVYERVFRPAEKRHEPWLERLRTQVGAGLEALEQACALRPGQWLVGAQLTQADITVTCAVTFIEGALSLPQIAERHPALSALVARCESLPQFAACRLAFSAPGG